MQAHSPRRPAGPLLALLVATAPLAALLIAAGGASAAPDLSTGATAYLDRDMDGFIDTVVVGLTASIELETVRPQDFRITTPPPPSTIPFSEVTPYNFCPSSGALPNPTVDCGTAPSGSATQFALLFEEQPRWRTDPELQLVYAAGTLRDSSGAAVPGTDNPSTADKLEGKNILDRAAPVLLGVTSSAATPLHKVWLSFSEPVKPGSGFSNDVADLLTYSDNDNAGREVKSETTPLPATGANAFLITLDDPGTAGNDPIPAASLGDESIRVVTNALIEVAKTATAVSPNTGLAVTAATPSKEGGAYIGPEKSIERPQVVSVEGGLGSSRLVVDFNAPVESNIGGLLTPSQFYISPAPSGTSGVNAQAVDHFRNAAGTDPTRTSVTLTAVGSPRVVLDLNKQLSSANDMGASGIQVQVSFSNSIRASADTSNTMQQQTASVADGSAPRITRAETMDLDVDGFLDTIKVVFSESVNDGTAGAWKVRFPSAGGSPPFPTSDVAAIRTGLAGDQCVAKAVPPSAAQDNVIFLCLQSTGVFGTGEIAALTFDTTSGSGTTWEDLAGNDLGMTNNFRADDKAPPFLKTARTVDADVDGKLDAYRLTFSESIDDTTFFLSSWAVAGHSLISFQSGTANDADAFLNFDELANYDTDAKPAITSTTPTVRDRAGNLLRAVASGDAVELDAAPPLLLKLEAQADAQTVTAYFSEPVQKAAASQGALDAGSFAYSNGNGDGAAQITSVQPAQSGFKTFTLTLDAKLTSSDFSSDRIAPELSAIQERATSGTEPALACGAPSARLCVLVINQLSFTIPGSVDTTPPGALSALSADAATKSHQVTVRWTAPGDDGALGGTVTGYIFKVLPQAQCPVTTFASDANEVPAGITVEPTLPLATPGTTQTATVKGLASGSTHCFTARARDDAGLTSQSFPTSVNMVAKAADATAPGVPGNVAVTTTHNSATITLRAPSDDGDHTGTEAVSGYNVKLATATFTFSETEGCTPFPNTPTHAVGTATVTVVTPLAAPGGTQTIQVTGLTPNTDYFFSVRAYDDEPKCSAGAAPVAASTNQDPTGPDTEAPGAVTALTVVADSVTANSVKLRWTAPGNDGASGTVLAYAVKASTTAIDAATATFSADELGGATKTLTPTPPAGPGTQQEATLTGLTPNTAYFFAVRAKDTVNLGPAAATTAATTTLADTTAPTGTLTVSSTTHEEGVATLASTAVFAWTPLVEDVSTVTYYWAVDGEEDTLLAGDGTDATTLTTVTVPGLEEGTHHFHVVGRSAGGVSDTAHYEVVVAGMPTAAELQAANEEVTDSLDLEMTGGALVLSWTIPADLPAPLMGVQVWKSLSPAQLVTTIPVGDPAFAAGSYTIATPEKGAKYWVTLYYGSTSELGYYSGTGDVPAYADLSELAPTHGGGKDGLAGWLIWAILGGAVLLLIVGIVVWMLVRRGSGQAAVTEEQAQGWPGEGGAAVAEGGESAWPAEAGEPAAAEEAWPEAEEATTGSGEAALAVAEAPAPEAPPVDLPVHNVTCPKCRTPFTAQGDKPLQIECPNCHVRGVLR